MKLIFTLLILSLFVIHPAFGQLSDQTGLKQHFTINADGQEFDVEITSSFDVQDVELYGDEKRLTLLIDSGVENNISEIIIPKNLINGNFTFYLNDQEVFPKVQGNEKISFITLKFQGSGLYKLDIIGTTYLPEFEGIVLLILGGSIFGILLVSRLKKNLFIQQGLNHRV